MSRLLIVHGVVITLDRERRILENGNDVDTVIVDGRVLMRHREVQTVDETNVLNEAARQYQLSLGRSGLKELTRIPERIWGHSRF